MRDTQKFRDLREALEREATHAEAALAALHAGEIDAITRPTAAAPILLRRTQQALLARERQFRAVFDNALNGMVVLDTHGRCVEANPAACEILGRERADVLGRRLSDMAVEPDSFRESWRALGAEHAAGGECQLRRPDGSVRDVEYSVTAHFMDALHLANFRDVTDRKRSEEAVARLAAIVESSEDAIIGKTLDGILTSWNAGAERMYGYRADEVLGRPVHVLAPPDRHQELDEILGKLRRGDRIAHFETVRRRKDGTSLDVSLTVSPIVDRHGRVSGASAIARDITARRRTDNALRASEERHRRIVETAQEGIWVIDAAGCTTYANQRLAELLGVRVEEIQGRSLYDFMAGEAQAEARAQLERRRRGIGEHVEFCFRRRDGSSLWALIAANPLFDESGEYVGALAMVADITARKRAEEELRESRATLERAQEVGRIGSFVSEPFTTGRVSWSKETCRIFGLDQDSFEGPRAAFYSIVHRDDLDAVQAAAERAFSGEAPYSLEHRIVQPDGTVRWVHVKAEVTRDRSGQALQLIGVVQDITERRHLEEQLRQAQKMEAVGRLAGGIAHDFNNLLGVILGYGALAMRRVGDDAVRGRIEEMVKAGERAAGLTRQLLAFSRKQTLEPKVLDLHALVSELEKMLRRVIGEDIQLVTVADDNLWRVKADPGQMEQVLMNLVVNARDAMPTGGRLTIETANVAIDDLRAAEQPGLRPGDYVLLAVSDTGVGMDEETRRRVFEPFFTTKEQGKGTGLGLSTAYGTISQSGGHITVHSEPARGTAFHVYLPRVDAPLEQAAASEDRHIPEGTETILVVEDSDSLRELTSEILAENGYEVLQARSGPAALECAGAHRGRIDLVLTDVVMPGMSGRELAEKLGERRPAPKVLFMSGYTDEAVVSHGVLAEGMAFVQKPFQLVTLLSKVREVLDRTAAD